MRIEISDIERDIKQLLGYPDTDCGDSVTRVRIAAAVQYMKSVGVPEEQIISAAGKQAIAIVVNDSMNMDPGTLKISPLFIHYVDMLR